MFSFVRRTFSILDRGARLRFVVFSIGSVVIALLEGLAMALVVPLIQVLLDPHAKSVKVPGPLKHLLHLSGSTGRAASVLGVLVFVTLTLKSVAAIFLLRWGITISLREEARVAKRLFSRYLRAPWTYHLKRHSAEIQRTLNESVLMTFRRTLPFIMAATADWFTLVAVALVIVLHDPKVAAISGLYFAVVGVVYQRFIGGRQKVAARQAHKEIARRYQQVQEAVRATKELAVLHREGYFVTQFYDTKLELVAAQRLLLFFQLVPRHFLDIALVFGTSIIGAFIFATSPRPEALATIGLFLTAAFRLQAPLNRVMTTFTLARTADPSINQVISDLAELDQLPQRPEMAPVPRGDRHAIELADVRFRYEDTDTDVLDGVSLRIEPGDDVGIVGTSGAGKTTMLDVLLGLLDPHAGDVLIGERPLSECRDEWQVSIGYVPQEVALLDDTIRANVAFGIAPAQIDDVQLQEALRSAQLDEFVATLPDGIETAIGEQGVRLSGGQRQRLGLARALYHRPSVLVLDEATSALDSDTEARIINTVASLRGSLTIITVAHRLSTLKHCDRIYFLRRGRLAAVGSFEELCAREPDFAQLVALAQLSLSETQSQATG